MAATAARAPAMVVMQGTPWLDGAGTDTALVGPRPLPLGVLTIRSIVPLAR